MLNLLVWAPAAFGLAVVALPRRARRIAAILGAVTPLGLLVIEPVSVARRWIPSVGASYELNVDGLSALLSSLVAVVAVVSLSDTTTTSRDRGAMALTLLAETALVGVFCASDALLLLAFVGAAIASLAFLSKDRPFAIAQWTGLGLLLGLFVICYQQVWAQTGFPTTSLSRFHSLVLFPGFERWAFLAGSAGPLIMMLTLRTKGSPFFAAAAYGIVPGFLLFRLVAAVFPAGAAEHAAAMRLVGLGAIAFACLSPFRRLAVAFQGLVLLGMFSLSRDGIVSAQLEWVHMGLALTAMGIARGTGRTLFVGVVAALIVLAPGGVSLLTSIPFSLAVLVAASWLLLALGVWRRRGLIANGEAAASGAGGDPSDPVVAAGTSWRLILVVGLLLALHLLPSSYRDRLGESAAPLLRTVAAMDEEHE